MYAYIYPNAFSIQVHQPFFRGDNPQDQLEIIVRQIGCPSMDKLAFIRPEPRQFLYHSAERSGPPPPFESLFPPHTNKAAIDILSKMLKFLPDERITVEQALSHHYLKDFHGQMDEPICSKLFDFNFEKNDRLSVGSEDDNRQEVRDSIFEEILHFRPAALAAVQEANVSAADAKMCSVPAGSYGSDFKGGDAKGDPYYHADNKNSSSSMEF